MVRFLSVDQFATLKYCPQLVNEMLSVLAQAWAYGKSRKGVYCEGLGLGGRV